MKFFYKLLALTVFLPLFSLAQGNYKQGFVINLKGDTLKGYIDLREWGSNPTSINFKTSLDKSSLQKFAVNDISYFEVTKITAYRQFITSISLDETNIQRVPDHRDTSSRMDNVFLKVEQRGKNVTLYSYTDDIKQRFYIYDTQVNRIAELTYRIYFVPNDKNNVTTVSQDAYKQQLLLTAQKFDTYNDNIKTLLEEANYNGDDLRLVCRKINNTSDKEEEAGKIKKPFVRFFADAAVGFNTINRTGTFPLYNSNPSHSSATPKISAGINFYPAPQVGRTVLRIEAAYTSVNYETSGNLDYQYNPDLISSFSFVQHNFSLTPQLQYNVYNSDAISFYLNVGLSINFSQYTGNTVYDPYTHDTYTDFSGLNDRWLSVPIKTGIILKNHLELLLTYIPTVSISDNHAGTHQDFDYSLNYTSLQAGLGYIF
ncbi:MAG TPA: hypothetical protein VGI43_05600 [Mucilaginibacter sp.]|jgi:hypothetical protein